jgi:hypothetical protein
MSANRLMFVAALLIVALAAPAPASSLRSAPAHSGNAPTPAAKKKRKCRAGRVPVTIVGRTRCKRVRGALPRPRAADMSLLLFRQALNLDLGGVRDRRGRRAPTMKKLFRRLGPRAYRFTQRQLPRALAAVDRAAAASRSAEAAATKFTCKNLPGSGWGGFSESGPNGLKLELKTNGRDLEASLEADRDGQRFRIDFLLDGCELSDPVPLPDCPTAAGRLHGRTKVKATIKVAVLDDGKFVHSYTLGVDGDTTVDATVGEDAKLDHLTIDDHQKSDEYVPALIRGIFGPMSVHANAHHKARFNLRSGRYESRDGEVEVDATLGGLVGIFLGGRFRAGATNRVTQHSDQVFAAVLARAIEELRERETAWQDPTCAELEFTPASGTLKLARDAAGDFSGRVIAKRGGGQAKGRWTKTGQQNATVTPDTATGESPSFHYTVTEAGPGKKVSAAFRATSPAGVATGTWEQDTEGEILYIGDVKGTLTHDQGLCPQPSHYQLSYSANLEKSHHTGGPQQPFPVVDEVTLRNPAVGIPAWGNAETGAGSYTIDPCPDDMSPGCSTPLHPNTSTGEYGRVIFSVEGGNVKATARAFSFESDAPSGDDCWTFISMAPFGIGTFPLSEVGAQTITVPLSINAHSDDPDDPNDYVGSGTLTLHRVK